MIIVYFNRGYTCIIYHLFNIAPCIAGGNVSFTTFIRQTNHFGF